MKSTDNHYWVALDHVRAFAAMGVFVWHFIHASTGYPVAFEGAPAVFPLALLDEGHTGVAIFMTLSGYLFAKLLDGKEIVYHKFLWNRFVRLAPLLIVVMFLYGALELYGGRDISQYPMDLAGGFVMPTWPNGGWSITAELHFYLLLPFILFLARRNANWLLALLVTSIGLRCAFYLAEGSVQDLAYFTIVGRIDQFALGVFFFLKRDWLVGRAHWLALAVTVYLGAIYLFDLSGGFYGLAGSYPSTSAWWIIIPTIEGATYATVIAWYDGRVAASNGRLSALAAQYGKFSYSIYLLHFFIVFRLARFIDERLFSLANFYVAVGAGIVAFLAMYPISWVSFKFIELPFLKLRTRYTIRYAQPEMSAL